MKLWKSGLLIVGLSLAAELTYIGWVSYLVYEAEAELRRIVHVKEMAATLSITARMYFSAGAALILASMTKEKDFDDRYEQAVSEIPDQVEKLKSLGDQKEIESIIEPLLKTGARVLSLFSKIRQYHREDIVRDPAGFQSVRTESELCLKQILKQQRNVELVAHNIIGKTDLQENRSRTKVVLWLILGIPLHAAFAFLLVRYFTNRLERLNTISDNANRLLAGLPLHPRLKRSDEIAELDSIFHDTAAVLNRSTRKERAWLDNAQDIICSLDRNLHFVKINPVCQRIWSREADALIGKSLLELLVPEDVEKARSFLNAVIDSPQSTTFETRIQHDSGGHVDMRWSIYWSSQENAFFCVAHDVSEQRKLARMKRQIVEMISQDLKTPLASILRVLELLASGALGTIQEKAKTRVAVAQRDVNRLLKLVNDLLEYERMEAGALVLYFELTDMQAAVNHAVEVVKSMGLTEQHGITLNVTVPENRLKLNMDRDRIVQVLINFLSNAIKFSPQHSTIEIEMVQDEHSTEVRVKDHGCGIPESYRATIFERFKQVPDSFNVRQGTGLGLAISKSIIEAHCGTIGVISCPGEGSTFWFRLPLSPQAQELANVRKPA